MTTKTDKQTFQEDIKNIIAELTEEINYQQEIIKRTQQRKQELITQRHNLQKKYLFKEPYIEKEYITRSKKRKMETEQIKHELPENPHKKWKVTETINTINTDQNNRKLNIKIKIEPQ